MENISVTRMDMMAVADAIAREKSIDREIVVAAIEEAVQKAGRFKYGQEHDIRARIDRRSGKIFLERYIEVVEGAPEDEIRQCTLEQARRKKADAAAGEFLVDPLPPIDFGRIAAQTAKQVIVQKVREAERERQYEEYKERTGQIVNGIVKRVDYRSYTIDLGRAEAVLSRSESIPRQFFKRGDRVRAYVLDVRRETRGPQIFLSRTHPNFLAKLFAQEVPEIYDNVVEIKAVARDPGSRAKIGVISNDSSVDPVGACVGMRGSRVQAVVGELQGERIDIIPWNPEPATFVVNALAPAEVAKVVVDEETRKMDVVVAEDQLSLAIGRHGQNVRLAANLTGWGIDIMTEDQESEKRQREINEASERFMEGLDVDEVIARLLVTEGFSTLEEVAYVPPEELATIEDFDDTLVGELQSRARNFLLEENDRLKARARKLGVEEKLMQLEGLTPQMLIALAEGGVRRLEDFAGFAADELVDGKDGPLRGFNLPEDAAADMVMAARVKAGWVTPAALQEMAAAAAEAATAQDDADNADGAD